MARKFLTSLILLLFGTVSFHFQAYADSTVIERVLKNPQAASVEEYNSVLKSWQSIEDPYTAFLELRDGAYKQSIKPSEVVRMEGIRKLILLARYLIKESNQFLQIQLKGARENKVISPRQLFELIDIALKNQPLTPELITGFCDSIHAQFKNNLLLPQWSSFPSAFFPYIFGEKANNVSVDLKERLLHLKVTFFPETLNRGKVLPPHVNSIFSLLMKKQFKEAILFSPTDNPGAALPALKEIFSVIELPIDFHQELLHQLQTSDDEIALSRIREIFFSPERSRHILEAMPFWVKAGRMSPYLTEMILEAVKEVFPSKKSGSSKHRMAPYVRDFYEWIFDLLQEAQSSPDHKLNEGKNIVLRDNVFVYLDAFKEAYLGDSITNHFESRYGSVPIREKKNCVCVLSFP
ncbi:MAG: hypothetical protein WCH11_00625 [Bdellovibrio sp.]